MPLDLPLLARTESALAVRVPGPRRAVVPMRLLVQIFFMAHLFAVHFGAEANQTLSVSAARAEMNWRCRVCVAIPTGVPAMARARHSGTTRVFVHCVLSGSSCCAPEGSPGRGESVGQPAKLSPQTLWREFVGCGCW